MKIGLSTKWKITLYSEEKFLINEALDSFFKPENPDYQKIKAKLKYDNVIVISGRELITLIRVLRHNGTPASKILATKITEGREKILEEKKSIKVEDNL